MAQKNQAYGLLINYEYCTGCKSCEMACSVEHNIPIGEFGIKVEQVGPWRLKNGKWQNDMVPIPTDMCNLCAERLAKGKKPTCVKHCQALVMEYGPVSELAAKMANASTKNVLFVPKAGTAEGKAGAVTGSVESVIAAGGDSIIERHEEIDPAVPPGTPAEI